MISCIAEHPIVASLGTGYCNIYVSGRQFQDFTPLGYATIGNCLFDTQGV